MNNTLKNILLTPMNIFYKIDPRHELKLMFYLKNGYKLNLDNPKTYNEKIQWIKLYNKNELMPICSDKYAVRQFVKDCGCGEILNDLLWDGFDAKEIPFEDLPEQFVIKITHGSGNNIVCMNKYKINKEKIIKKLNRWLKQKYLLCYGEWFYGVIRPRIIIEKFLPGDNFKIPDDYKVMCFNGEPKYIFVYTDRFEQTKESIYDINWNKLDCNHRGVCRGKLIEKPDNLNEILEYSKKLSKKFCHTRVDFYIVNNKVYFGEFTFTDGAGFDKIIPHSYDIEMGNLLKL